MIGRVALVPVKGGRERKSRLAGVLAPEARERLAEAMFRHVLDVLEASACVSDIVVLSPLRPAGWGGTWRPDGGAGLNAELQHAVEGLGAAAALVIHADLPTLTPADVAALCDAADAREGAVAMAPDRHMTGTNALALPRQAPFRFRFGPDSYAHHQREAGERARTVRRPGLALDVDVPDDLALLPPEYGRIG